MLEMTFLGSGNAFVSGGRYWSSFLANGRYLFDAPPTLLPHLKPIRTPPPPPVPPGGPPRERLQPPLRGGPAGKRPVRERGQLQGVPHESRPRQAGVLRLPRAGGRQDR